MTSSSQSSGGNFICMKCANPVYANERVSVHSDRHFHKACFRCSDCAMQLSMNTYMMVDQVIYCRTHAPKPTATHLNADDIKMKSALSAQAYFSGRNRDISPRRHDSMTSKANVDIKSVQIRNAMDAQRLRRGAKATYSRHRFYPVSQSGVRKKIAEAQKLLESQHREEETKLLQEMAQQRDLEWSKVERDYVEEFSKSLTRANADNFMSKMKNGRKKEDSLEQREEESNDLELPTSSAPDLIGKHLEAKKREFSVKRIEEDRERTSKLVEKQSKEMLELLSANRDVIIPKDENEMPIDPDDHIINLSSAITLDDLPLDYIKDKKPVERSFVNFGHDLEDKVLEEFIYSTELYATPHKLKRNASTRPSEDDDAELEDTIVSISATQPYYRNPASRSAVAKSMRERRSKGGSDDEVGGGGGSSSMRRPSMPPNPTVELKATLFENVEDFYELDSHVIQVADKEHNSFTELVLQLTDSCQGDLDKVRAIFRWITVKDLNAIDLGGSIDPDSPMGLLRGIKQGLESYHTLFMRLCSYAGLYCVEVKGYSKSVGYEPGVVFNDNTKSLFTNAWNAVWVNDSWRLIQCNWAARHLVKRRRHEVGGGEVPPYFPSQPPSSTGPPPPPGDHDTLSAYSSSQGGLKYDPLRYDYDEHYFLTDPHDFIMEFWPFDPQWQLLPRPLTLPEFEQLPFVRSTFFQCGLHYPRGTRAVLQADEMGKASVEIWMKQENSVNAQYRFSFAEERLKSLRYFNGYEINRFVMFNNFADRFVFDIHLPCNRPFVLEVFSLPVVPADAAGGANHKPARSLSSLSSRQQTALKLATKIKILPPVDLKSVLKPLPATSNVTSEWGPGKALRLHGVKAISHPNPIISYAGYFQLELHIPESMQKHTFEVTVSKTNVNRHLLTSQVQCEHLPEEHLLVVKFQSPCEGQYALEILHSSPESNYLTLRELCKYLLNCTGTVPEFVQVVDVSQKVLDDKKLKAGPTQYAKSLGMSFPKELQQKWRIDVHEESVRIPFQWKPGSKPSSSGGSKGVVRFAFRLLEIQPDFGDFTDLLRPVCLEGVNQCELHATLPFHGIYQLYIFAQSTDAAAFHCTHVIRLTRLQGSSSQEDSKSHHSSLSLNAM